VNHLDLRHMVEIRRKQQTQQADGSLDTTLSLVAKAYAAVYPMRGDERREGQQLEAQANYRFHIHQRNDLREDDVIVWNGHEYNIRFIADRGPGSVYMMLEAERGVAV